MFSCLECLSYVITLDALGDMDGVPAELHYEFYTTLDCIYYLKKVSDEIKNKKRGIFLKK
jgi:hypothetical protein